MYVSIGLIMMPPSLSSSSRSHSISREVRTYAITYEFKVVKDWWNINKLLLASPKDPALTMSLYDFYNLVVFTT
jgi:hypothetical protein